MNTVKKGDIIDVAGKIYRIGADEDGELVVCGYGSAEGAAGITIESLQADACLVIGEFVPAGEFKIGDGLLVMSPRWSHGYPLMVAAVNSESKLKIANVPARVRLAEHRVIQPAFKEAVRMYAQRLNMETGIEG